MVRSVTPTNCGQDLVSRAQKLDAHIRYEEWDEDAPYAITIDVFDSRIKDANKAHLDSVVFENTRHGLEDATVYLKTRGFNVVVNRAKLKSRCP